MLGKNHSLVRWAALLAGGALLALAYLWWPAQTTPSIDTPSGAATQITELQRAIAEGPYTEAMRGSERKVAAFSDEYFELLKKHPALAKVFAFSTRIVVVVAGSPIEIE